MSVTTSLSPAYMTRGERLLEFLRTRILVEIHDSGLASKIAAASYLVDQEGNYLAALQDLVTVQFLRRLLLTSRWAFKHYCNEEEADDERDVLMMRHLTLVLKNQFQIDSSQIDSMSNRIIDATKASRGKISPSLKREVFDVHGLSCYSCGIELTRRSGKRDEATVEHLWPQALGGDTNFENLLPACKGCNNHKDDYPVWSSFWFQQCFLGPHSSQQSIESKLGLRTRVALQFYRAHKMSLQKYQSLKQTFIQLGPLDIPDVSNREYPSDFFNILEDTTIQQIGELQ